MKDGEEHREAQDLLPWFVTGKLDPDEHARVAAHVEGCAECQAEARFQQRLESEVARLPVDVEAGWARMRRQVEAQEAGPARRMQRLIESPAAWIAWGLAASLALVIGATLLPPPAPDGAYHALGAAPAPPAGNVMVIFRPDATEADLRGVLKAAHARLVDGPTAADAWVLAVPGAERAVALTTLKARHEVVLAEPIDSGGAQR